MTLGPDQIFETGESSQEKPLSLKQEGVLYSGGGEKLVQPIQEAPLLQEKASSVEKSTEAFLSKAESVHEETDILEKIISDEDKKETVLKKIALQWKETLQKQILCFSQNKNRYSPEIQSKIKDLQEQLEELQNLISENKEKIVLLNKKFEEITVKLSAIYYSSIDSEPLNQSTLEKWSLPWKEDLDQYNISFIQMHEYSAPAAQQEITVLQTRIRELKNKTPSTNAELAQFIQDICAIEKELERINTINTYAKLLKIEPKNWNIAAQIYEHYKNNWAGCYEIVHLDDGKVVYKQLHGIKHLKIYKDPISGILVADYGIKKIDAGAYKRIKEAVRLEQSITNQVRLTSPTKSNHEDRSETSLKIIDASFLEDVTTELKARECIGPETEDITQIVKIQYMNEEGVLKTRYVMRYYPETLHEVAYDEDKERSLHCCLGPIRALTKLHKKNLIHGDVKADNILVEGDSGVLNDFGLSGMIGTEPSYGRGSAAYNAPEDIFFDPITPLVRNTALDMFSAGILLLHAAFPRRYTQWRHDIRHLEEMVRKSKKTLMQLKEEASIDEKQNILLKIVKQIKRFRNISIEETEKQYQSAKEKFNNDYIALLEQLHSDLKKETLSDPIFEVINRLTDLDPKLRPSAEETVLLLEDRLQHPPEPVTISDSGVLITLENLLNTLVRNLYI